MIPELEGLYPEGSDLTIMNTHYNYPVFIDGKKVCDDFICLVYKNNKTGEKDFKIISKPNYTYYVVKNEEDKLDYSRLFIERDKVEPVTVPFRDIERNIADQTGNLDAYKQNLANRDKDKNRRLHAHPDIFFSDANIEDHYRFKFAQTYTNDIKKISKGFFDIEVDGKFAKGDFVEFGECPINCVSFMDEKSDKVFTFILRNPDNPLIEKFENEIVQGKFTQDDIRNFVIQAVNNKAKPGEDRAIKYGLTKTQFEIYFFDEEIDLIKSLFIKMHFCSPDFIEGWNSSGFDLEYIIERIKVLGYDPADIMCDPRWSVKVVKNYVDMRNKNDLAERGDYTFISGLPVFIDQMIQYASRRKSKIGSYKSFKLDDIGLLETGVQKLDYHHITTSVLELPWLDFKTFTLYNIMDVIVQKCIESKTNDLEYIFSKCIVNNTVYRKGHRQTVYLVNRMAADWYKMGYIIGNNINRWNDKPPKFLGALVGKPLNTNDYSKLKINGRAIWVCDNLQDYDYKSLYPSIMGEFNIAPNTQVGKIEIPDQVYEHENIYHEEKYSRSGEFIENLVTDNVIEYCKRWFHLAGIKEFIDDIDEFYIDRGVGKFSNLMKAGFKESPLIPASDNIISPVSFTNKAVEKPIVFYNNIPESVDRQKLLMR